MRGRCGSREVGTRRTIAWLGSSRRWDHGADKRGEPRSQAATPDRGGNDCDQNVLTEYISAGVTASVSGARLTSIVLRKNAPTTPTPTMGVTTRICASTTARDTRTIVPSPERTQTASAGTN